MTKEELFIKVKEFKEFKKSPNYVHKFNSHIFLPKEFDKKDSFDSLLNQLLLGFEILIGLNIEIEFYIHKKEEVKFDKESIIKSIDIFSKFFENNYYYHFFKRKDMEYFNEPLRTEKTIQFLEKRIREIYFDSKNLSIELKKLENEEIIKSYNNLIFQLDNYYDDFQLFIDEDEIKKTFNNKNIIDSVFINSLSKEIFEYLVENWSYTKDLRFAYIYNYLVDEKQFHIDFSLYQKFISNRFNIPRVFCSNASSEKVINSLKETLKNMK